MGGKDMDDKEIFKHKIKVIEKTLLSGRLDNDKEQKERFLFYLNKLYEICKTEREAA